MDLSFRTAPGTNEIKAAEELKALIEKDPPYGANVCTLGLRRTNAQWARLLILHCMQGYRSERMGTPSSHS